MCRSEIVLDVGDGGLVQVEDRILQEGREGGGHDPDDVDPRHTIGGEADEGQARLLALPVELDDGARQQRDEVSLPDFRLQQVDGDGDGPLQAEGEDAGLQAARLLVDVQDLFRHFRPSDEVGGQVYLGEIRTHVSLFWGGFSLRGYGCRSVSGRPPAGGGGAGQRVAKIRLFSANGAKAGRFFLRGARKAGRTRVGAVSHAVLRVFEGYWLMVDGSRCLGLDATKVSQMFGTAKNGGAIKGLFSVRILEK